MTEMRPERSGLGAHRLTDIPSLTGLRFFAALFVALGHATPALIRLGPEPVLLLALLAPLTPVGMSLFFVLSGFVIHYNYSGLLTAPAAENLAKFLMARFARLYPLYLLIVLVEIGFSWKAADLPVLPFYLTMSQSWFFGLFDGTSPIHHLRLSAVSWSISTEWFFYCSYPFIMLALGGDHRSVKHMGRLALLAGFCMALSALGHVYYSAVDDVGGKLWGSAVTGPAAANNSFAVWLLNYSPFGRMHEFLVGVVTGQLYLQMADKPPTQKETSVALIVLMLGFVTLAGTFYLLQQPIASPIMTPICKFSIPVSIAVILFCCARYRSKLAAFLSWRSVVTGGEASYSIYLFHLVILQAVAIPVVLSNNMEMRLYVMTRLALSISLILLVSIGTYLAFESPTRAAIRSFYDKRENRFTALWVIAILIGAPLACSVYGWIAGATSASAP
jgi:peptidoglycan/LPS O-acetylase OafA/YrhL